MGGEDRGVLTIQNDDRLFVKAEVLQNTARARRNRRRRRKKGKRGIGLVDTAPKKELSLLQKVPEPAGSVGRTLFEYCNCTGEGRVTSRRKGLKHEILTEGLVSV